jgi:hypothetical protein
MAVEFRTARHHAQDVQAAIGEQADAFGDVVLHAMAGQNGDKSHNQSGLEQRVVL